MLKAFPTQDDPDHLRQALSSFMSVVMNDPFPS
jgi:hypothetical protein